MSSDRIHVKITTRGLDTMATRAELEKENADLRARLAKYEGGRPAGAPVSFGMSEGVRTDIEQAKVVMASDDPARPKEVVVKDGGTGVTYRVYRDGDTVAVEEYEPGATVPVETSAPGRTDELPAE
jgi:hypothetical protein